MTDLAAGDLVFHYAHQRILAVGRIRGPARTHPRPEALPSQLWQQNGWLAEIDSVDLAVPIHRDEIPLEWRRPRQQPCFDVNGQVVLGYLFPLSDGFADKLLEQFKVGGRHYQPATLRSPFLQLGSSSVASSASRW
jgi:hypothetical protein